MMARFTLALVLLAATCSGWADGLAGQRITPMSTGADAGLSLHGGAQIAAVNGQDRIDLPAGGYAEWRPPVALTTDAGSLVMWIQPLWQPGDHQSHAFMTFQWSGSDHSYFALSQGWWEPQGSGKLYAVLSNQQFVFCLMPWKFDYTLFLPRQWTMLAVTWQAGNPGFLRLYVDGKRMCERKAAFIGGRHHIDPLYLGSDRGADLQNRGRASSIAIERSFFAARPMSDQEIHRAYLLGGGHPRSKWIVPLLDPSRAARVNPTERRLMMDEDTSWANSRLEIQKRIARIKAAGFNSYAPCVWDGSHAFFGSRVAPLAASVSDAADRDYDPLQYLIEVAHKSGIAVYPWFDVARRGEAAATPPGYAYGAPAGAFNLHNAGFRDFVVGLVVDAARRYDIDGVNLDYVRTIGPCSNPECVNAYARQFGRSLATDWSLEASGATVPSLIAWNRAVINDIVARISAGVRQARPRAAIIVDTVPYDHDRSHQGMDEPAWLRQGLVDALVDMAYEDPIDVDTLDRAVRVLGARSQFIATRNYDQDVDGPVTDRSGADVSDYVRLIRSRWPGVGIAFYHYPHLSWDQIQQLGHGVFSQAPSLERRY